MSELEKKLTRHGSVAQLQSSHMRVTGLLLIKIEKNLCILGLLPLIHDMRPQYTNVFLYSRFLERPSFKKYTKLPFLTNFHHYI